MLTLNRCILGLQTCNQDLLLKLVSTECHIEEHHHQIHNLQTENKLLVI